MHSSSRTRLNVLLIACCLYLLAFDSLSTQGQGTPFTTLHSFAAYGTSYTNSDGAGPYSGLLLGPDGNFYGTTRGGGPYSVGTVFQITPTGTLTSLHAFSDQDGAYPRGATLIQGTDGNFYGTTSGGGSNGGGTVFKVTPDGTVTTLYSFNSSTDGEVPVSSLIQASDSNFYGTTSAGGANGSGTVFRLTPSGEFSVVYTFSALSQSGTNSDGNSPRAGLIQGKDGNFYGTAAFGGPYGSGTVFRLTPDGTLTVLSSHPGGHPCASLIQGLDGNFYSTTPDGGDYGYGSVFRITPAGVSTILHSFTYGEGGYSVAALLQRTDGNFYGVGEYYGANGTGTVFQMTKSGIVTVLHAFSAQTSNPPYSNSDGSEPLGTLAEGSDGIYGTAIYGGENGTGTVFRIELVPVLSGLSPSSVDAGGSSFTLAVKGNSFVKSSIVYWSGSALTTTYVTAALLKAAVPASLIANPGKVSITVVSPGGTSKSKPLSILLTSLKLTGATLIRNSTTGVITANLSLQNTGYKTASNVSITGATLGAAATSSTLPSAVGTITAGALASTSLTFPGSAGNSGSVATLRVAGTFTGGKFSGSLKVTLP